MEWQERLRAKFRPGLAETKEAECLEAVYHALLEQHQKQKAAGTFPKGADLIGREGEGLPSVEMSQELPLIGPGASFARAESRAAGVGRLPLRTTWTTQITLKYSPSSRLTRARRCSAFLTSFSPVRSKSAKWRNQ